ncbi:MAG TPA: alpha/beta hydrolase [Longimicrobium sp.]|nr:alpha/beta hydrolase [Longimicrobium sp.]
MTVPTGDAAVAWSREQWVRVGPFDVRYREAGQGPAVVLVHGLGLSADFWWRNGPPLATAGFRVLAPDLPGFGKTDGPAYLTVNDQADFVGAWADALELGPTAYVGHSVSCQVSLQLAADRPERVTALVLAAPTGDPAPLRLVRQALGFVADPVFEPPSLVPAVGEPYFRAGIPRWLRTWYAAGRHDTMAVARRVTTPGIVVLGRHDPVVRRGFARELAECLPGGRCIVLPRGAHAVVFDAADDFNAEVAAFLREAHPPR